MLTSWRFTLVHAATVSLIVLGLFYYWFAVADRYAVFLYGHTTTNISDAQPFDEITSSRYWMAGLVAAGVVLVLDLLTFWTWGLVAARRGRAATSPGWRRTWLTCALPIGLGVPAITLTVNAPTLPLDLALACAATGLAGLAIALMAGDWAARRSRELPWLMADGLGLVPALMLVRAVELPGRGLSITTTQVAVIVSGGLIAGAIWLIFLTVLRSWRRVADPGAAAILTAGLAWSYLALPLVHHLFATPPGFRYISAASNFFAFDPGVQVAAVALAGATALGASRLRRRHSPRDASANQEPSR